MNKYYGVSQSRYGHEYRWIFTEEEMISQIGKELFDNLSNTYGSLEKENWWVDILFPMGGSNSSATEITYLKDDEAIKAFLTAPALGPDLEDPMLIDIAEYLLTIDVDCGSCTQQFLDKFGLNMRDLEQDDDQYNHRKESERMIAELLSSGNTYDDVIDRDNPFYGDSSDLRFNELCDIYEEYLKTKEEQELE